MIKIDNYDLNYFPGAQGGGRVMKVNLAKASQKSSSGGQPGNRAGASLSSISILVLFSFYGATYTFSFVRGWRNSVVLGIVAQGACAPAGAVGRGGGGEARDGRGGEGGGGGGRVGAVEEESEMCMYVPVPICGTFGRTRAGYGVPEKVHADAFEGS